MTGLHTLRRSSERLRALNVLALTGWAAGLFLFPITLQNPGYGGMSYLPPYVWAMLFALAAAGLALTSPGKHRAAAGTLAMVLWGTVALSIFYPLAQSGPGVGSLPGVLLYAILALSTFYVIQDGAK